MRRWRTPKSVSASSPPAITPEVRLAKLEEAMEKVARATSEQAETSKRLFAMLERAASPAPSRPPEPDEDELLLEDVSEEALDKALMAGESPGALIKKAAAALVQRELRPLAQRVRTHENHLGAVSAQLGRDPERMPYYDRFKEEIEKRSAMLPANVRMDPEKYAEIRQAIHDQIVGANHKTIKAEELEALNRDAAGTPPGGHRPGKLLPDGKPVPRPQEFFGAAALKTLGDMYGGETDPDELGRLWARDQRYRNFDEFAMAQLTSSDAKGGNA